MEWSLSYGRTNKWVKITIQLPENIKPLVLIVIGYPAEHLPVVDRYDASRVHYNTFEIENK